MKPLLLVASSLLLSTAVYAEHNVHWAYDGEAGPEHWGELADEFKTCASGKNQTPINLDSRREIEAELPPLQINYQAGGNEVLNNGHTIQVQYEPGSTLQVDKRDFELKQFHFHSPSENLIDGQSHPLEAHLVHADKDGNLAVISLMFDEGEANAGLDQFWPKMPTEADDEETLDSKVDVSTLLPANRDYYRFNGSLTTPPCTEGVIWLVMKQPVMASREQVKAFSKLMGHPNTRPIQPVNARPILK